LPNSPSRAIIQARMSTPPLSAVRLSPPKEQRSRSYSLLVLFVLPLTIFAGLVAYGHFERTTAAPLQQGQPGSLVWGDGKVIFSNKAQLAAWLRLHGSSYGAFVKHHPDALRLVTGRPGRHVPATAKRHVAPTTHVAARPTTKPKPAAAVKKKVAPTVTVTITAPAAPKTAATRGSGPTSRSLVFSIAAVLGLLLGVLALLPPAAARRFGLRSSPERARELRFSAAAVSVAILAGVLFGLLLG